MVFYIFLVGKYPFRVNLIQKFKRTIIRQNLVPTLECLIDVPPLINLSIFSHLLINYWRKFSTRVWNDILVLTFSQSRKRSDPSVMCFALQVRAKKPTQCFVLWVSIKKPTYCQLLTSFHRSNRTFVDVFIECVAWSYWWSWCVLLIICISKHFSFFVFYFNVSNKLFRLFQSPVVLGTQE